jgi:hypothetical protein
MKTIKYLSASLLSLSLIACGGGGGSSETPVHNPQPHLLTLRPRQAMLAPMSAGRKYQALLTPCIMPPLLTLAQATVVPPPAVLKSTMPTPVPLQG